MEKDNEPLTIDEIEKQPKPDKPKLKPSIGYPTGVGNTGWSLGKMKQRNYRDDDEDAPDGSTIGAKVIR